MYLNYPHYSVPPTPYPSLYLPRPPLSQPHKCYSRYSSSPLQGSLLKKLLNYYKEPIMSRELGSNRTGEGCLVYDIVTCDILRLSCKKNKNITR